MENNIGIDISKSHLDVFHLEADDARRFENSAQGLCALQKWLVVLEVTRFVFEATGALSSLVGDGAVGQATSREG